MATLGFDEIWEMVSHGEESVAVEVKRATQIDRAVLQTISAFANTPDRGGGYLLLGVSEREDLFGETMYEITGVDDPAKLQTDLASQCAGSLRPPVRPVITIERRDGKAVLLVHVPEVAAQDKPVFIVSEGLPKGAYLRVGSTDQHCTEDDLAVLFQQRGATTYDQTAIAGTGMADVDGAAIAEYRRARALINPGASELALDDGELLHSLYATADGQGGRCLTVAGLVLFGKEASLRRHMPAMRVDYIRVDGREWVPDPEKRYSAVEMRGPLLTLAARVVQQVLADVPSAFSLTEGSLHRQETPLVPRTVIREAVVNALMHRSYRVRSPMQIIRYTNRLEIKNPGHSLKPDDRLGEPGSVARNEKIAAVLHEVGLAETKGTGIRAMQRAMRTANLTLPIFESDHVRDEFVVRLLVHHLVGPEDVAWLGQFADCGLSDGEAKAMLVLREVGGIDNSVYRDINGVDTLTASRALTRLREAGLLEKRGKGNATYYVATERAGGAPGGAVRAGGATEPRMRGPGALPSGGRVVQPVQSEAEPVTPTAQPVQPEAQPVTPNAQPVQPEAQPVESTAQPVEPVAQPVEPARFLIGSERVPQGLRELVIGLGGRPDPVQVEAVLEALCGWRALRAVELGRIMDRNPVYLRTQYLTPMVEMGRLSYAMPEHPHHPEQRYMRHGLEAGGER